MTTAKQTTPAASPPAGEFKIVLIDKIFVTKNNFRQDFDQVKLNELAESIKKHGIAQPLLLRAWPVQGSRSGEVITHVSEDLSSDKRAWRVWRGGLLDKEAIDLTGRLSQAEAKKQRDTLEQFDFALVAGERRLRAAKIAGLTEVPAMVRRLTDEDVDELMVIENMQREDLHPLEYAEGFERLIQKHGYTVETLAAKVHKGTTFIRDLLHLAKLPKVAREAFQEGDINKSVAVLIASVPDETMRGKFAKEVVTRFFGRTMSFREAKEHKEQNYMKELKGAPFALDQQLDPEWPHSCLTCPHYNGNTEEKYKGKRSDLCLNPPHYDVLVRIHGRQLVAAAREQGAAVLNATEATKLFRDRYYGSEEQCLIDGSSYVDCGGDLHDYKTSKSVSWGRIVKDAKLETVIAIDGKGQAHKLAKRSEAEKAAKDKGIQLSYSTSSTARKSSSGDKKRETEAKARTIAATEAINKILSYKFEKATTKAWRELASRALHTFSISGDGIEFLAAVLGFVEPAKSNGLQGEKFVRGHLAKLSTSTELQAFVIATMAAELLETATNTYSRGFEPEDLSLCKSLGIDLKALETKAKASIAREIAAKKPAKKAAKKKPASAPARKKRSADART